MDLVQTVRGVAKRIDRLDGVFKQTRLPELDFQSHDVADEILVPAAVDIHIAVQGLPNGGSVAHFHCADLLGPDGVNGKQIVVDDGSVGTNGKTFRARPVSTEILLCRQPVHPVQISHKRPRPHVQKQKLIGEGRISQRRTDADAQKVLGVGRPNQRARRGNHKWEVLILVCPHCRCRNPLVFQKSLFHAGVDANLLVLNDAAIGVTEDGAIRIWRVLSSIRPHPPFV